CARARRQDRLRRARRCRAAQDRLCQRLAGSFRSPLTGTAEAPMVAGAYFLLLSTTHHDRGRFSVRTTDKRPRSRKPSAPLAVIRVPTVIHDLKACFLLLSERPAVIHDLQARFLLLSTREHWRHQLSTREHWRHQLSTREHWRRRRL